MISRQPIQAGTINVAVVVTETSNPLITTTRLQVLQRLSPIAQELLFFLVFLIQRLKLLVERKPDLFGIERILLWSFRDIQNRLAPLV